MQSDNDSDKIDFLPESALPKHSSKYNLESCEYWNVLIADDAKEMHTSTKFALNQLVICGKKINWLDTFTAEETKNLILERDDIHLILLDAVMENERAGIDCAKFIKQDLSRELPIIVMRTGFAGWEVECDLKTLAFIDDFILKSNTSRSSLIDILEKWLRHVSEL